MKTFETKILTFTDKAGPDPKNPERLLILESCGAQFETAAKPLGAEGWALVAIHGRSGSSFSAFFQREILAQTNPIVTVPSPDWDKCRGCNGCKGIVEPGVEGDFCSNCLKKKKGET